MQTEEILLAYEKRRLIRRYAGIGFLVSAVFWVATANYWLMLSRWFFLGGVTLLSLLYGYVLWRYWRCPVCDRTLGREEHAYCPKCGERLVA